MFANGRLGIIFGINSGYLPGGSALLIRFPDVPEEPFAFDMRNITFVLSGGRDRRTDTRSAPRSLNTF